MKVAAIIPAAGLGKRLKSKSPKAFALLGGKPLLARTLSRLLESYPFHEIVVAAHPKKIDEVRKLVRSHRQSSKIKVVGGGATRSDSVLKALLSVSPGSDWVLVHDAARPLVSRDLIRRLLGAAKKRGAVLCALPATATVKRVDPRTLSVLKTEDRRQLYLAQTPQVFKRKLLLERYRKLGKTASLATDEAALFDGSKTRVSIVLGDPFNLKITTPFDLKLAEGYLKEGR